jgi:putative sterol carrier protein
VVRAPKPEEVEIDMTDEQTPSAQDLTPEMFNAMVKGKSDEEILTTVKGNEEALLDGIFDAMKEAFDPSKATGQSAIIQYDLDTPRGRVSYQLNVDNGTCTLGKGTDGTPRVTLALNLPDFVRLIAGELDPMNAFTSGKLKISGDIMFSQNVGNWFAPPSS